MSIQEITTPLRALCNILFLLIIGGSLSSQNIKSSVVQEKIDSILDLRSQSNDKSLSVEERFSLAERARRMSIELDIDTTIIKSNMKVASLHKTLENFNLFKKISWETLELAKKNKDTSTIALINFRLGSYYQSILVNDSAYHYYYSAQKTYESIQDNYNTGRVLLNMAIIQKNEKDFIGSESNSILAIPYLESVIKTRKLAYRPLSSVYNNLAIVSRELGNYDKAIEYYYQAITYQRQQKDPRKLLELLYINNLAMVYEKLGDYDKSLEFFSDLLEEDVLNEDKEFYARVIDNYARTKFLIDKDDKDLPRLFFEAIRIRGDIDDKGGSMRNSIDLSEYYLAHEDLDKAQEYANLAYSIAHDYNRFDSELEILLLLAKIEKGDQALAHTQKYIELNDSLQKAERAIRNKFARIDFETGRIEEQNVKFSRERELFLFLGIAGLVGAILIYIIISQRSRNNELRFTQEQQKANEEIYNLMLSQQDKIEEGRTKEKRRISEDLHDGILGRLFGTRLSLDSLNMSSDEDTVKNRGQYIEELKSIEQEIRRISHDLNADFVVGSGYLDIVKTLIDNQTQAYNKLSFNFTHKDEIDWEGVSNKTKINFYRMIQESLQNIYKHANAKHVDISFEMKDHQIYLNIEDDGEGFVVNKAKRGIGLKNIKSRVEELKGELFINSQKDAGTRISISVPL